MSSTVRVEGKIPLSASTFLIFIATEEPPLDFKWVETAVVIGNGSPDVLVASVAVEDCAGFPENRFFPVTVVFAAIVVGT